jgi:hypothetical protein
MAAGPVEEWLMEVYDIGIAGATGVGQAVVAEACSVGRSRVRGTEEGGGGVRGGCGCSTSRL